MKSLNKLLVVSIATLFSIAANANLLTNGSFEDNTLNSGSWGLFNQSNVNGWQGESIELWNNLNGLAAFDGTNLTELNSNRNGGVSHTLFQTFTTTTNGIFSLDFAYRARSNSNEAFKVDIFSTNGNVFSQIFDDHTKGQWSTFSGDFTANDATSTIMFTSIAPLSSVGNLIDNVIIDSKQVSAPATILITLLAAPVLLMRRLRK